MVNLVLVWVLSGCMMQAGSLELAMLFPNEDMTESL